MMEEWKDILGYEGLYQVSSLGRVKSLPKSGSGGHEQSVILREGEDKDGYVQVVLFKNGKGRTCRTHRLVAQAFISNYSSDLEINHKNEVKSDNNVSNLEMCNRQYNIDYGTRTLKYYKPIIQRTIDGDFIAEYPSVDEAAKAVNGLACNITRYLKGGYKSHNGKIYSPKHSYGYKWEYKQD